MVEATTGWLETYPVPHATARNTILGLEKQVLLRQGTPERIKSENKTDFHNSLIDTWAKEHGYEWVYHIHYHAPASRKIEWYNGLLKTTLKAMGGGTFKNWDTHLPKAIWLVNTRGYTNRAGPAQSKPQCPVEGDKVPVVNMRNMLGKTVWVSPASGKGKSVRGIAFAQGPGCTWWVMRKDGESTESTERPTLLPPSRKRASKRWGGMESGPCSGWQANLPPASLTCPVALKQQIWGSGMWGTGHRGCGWRWSSIRGVA